MSNRADYVALCRLRDNPDYQVLTAKWIYLLSKIETARDNSASRGQESAWRYFAGQEKGAKIMMMALDLAIKDLENQDQELMLEQKRNDLLKEVRGEV